MLSIREKPARGGAHDVQQARAGDTRRRLLASARLLFAEVGFVGTGIKEIVAAASLTRGAFYHHFADKTAIFEAVFRDTAEALNDKAKLVASESAKGSWDRVVAAYRAYLDLIASDTVYQRILLVDGPAVLGWKRWRSLHSDYVARRTENALRVLIVEGEIADQPVGPLANLIQAALNDAALTIAESDDPASAAAEAGGAFIFLLERIHLVDRKPSASHG